VRIELDLFSGRANPEFELDVDEERHLAALLDALPEEAEPGARDASGGGLGYRGAVITRDEGTVRVRGAVVEIVGSDPPLFRTDVERALERAVAAIAARHVPPDVHRFLVSCLAI
jgi:hypothetical protein